MAKSLKYLFSLLAFVVLLSSCSKDEELCGFSDESVSTEKMLNNGDKENAIQLRPALRDGGDELPGVSDNDGSGNSDPDGNGISDDDDDESDDDKSGKVKSN